MKNTPLDVTEDDLRYWGHAQLRFRGTYNLSGTVQLIITRNAEEPYLGAAGWQTAPAFVDAEVLSSDANETVLLLKPEVCDFIPLELQIKVEIKDKSIFGKAFWPSIPPSLKRSDSPFTPLPKTSPPQPQMHAVAETVEPAVPKPQQEALVEKAELVVKRRRSPWPLTIGLLLIVMLCLAGAGYVYRTPLMAIVDQYTAHEIESLSDKFARLKAEGASGDEFYAFSHEAFDASNKTLGLEGMSLAVERGSKRAKLETAEWYDPLSFAADRVPAVDANRAARAYFELAVEGDPAAVQRLQALCGAAHRPDAAHRTDFAGLLASTYCEGSVN